MSWHRVLTRALVLGSVLTLGWLSQLGAQELPRRPKLPDGQDTNNAINYYKLGHAVLGSDARKAADAFYWASRVDPVWAAPVYARGAAILLGRSDMELTNYLTAKDNNGRKSFHEIDSISYLAQLKNAFVDRTIDAITINAWLLRYSKGGFGIRDAGRYDKRFEAWAQTALGNYPTASKILQDQVRRYPADLELRWMQTRNYFAAGQYDSARVAMKTTLDLIRHSEANVLGWMPHAYVEYAVGSLYAVSAQWDSARAAYERSVLDDLAFYPAHRDLGRLRLIAGDTAGAMAEFNEAAGLAPTEVGILYELGSLLMKKGKVDSASKLLKLAISEEPWYAAPYLPLGVIFESSGYKEEAIQHYKSFLARAAQGNPQIAIAQRRLAAAGGSE